MDGSPYPDLQPYIRLVTGCGQIGFNSYQFCLSGCSHVNVPIQCGQSLYTVCLPAMTVHKVVMEGQCQPILVQEGARI